MFQRSLRRSSPLFQKTIASNYSTSTGKAVTVELSGNKPVLKLNEFSIPTTLKENEVLVKMTSAAINRGDIEMIEGKSSLLGSATYPSVLGSEGSGVVTSIGSSVRNIQVGDTVFPTTISSGTWRTHMVGDANNFFAVKSKAHHASMITAPLAAHLMLSNFVNTKPGDVIMQNAANGAVGMAVVQLAFKRGLRTINVIRKGDKYPEVNERLKQMGGFIVCPYDYVSSHFFRRLISDIPKPVLAINAIGGASATELARTLAPGGTMVTYSGLSHKTIQIPTSSFLLNDITLKGFWLPNWMANTSQEQKQQTLQKVAEEMPYMQLFAETFKLSDFSRAIDRFGQERHNRVLLTME